MMFATASIIELISSYPFVEIEQWSETAYCITVGTVEMTEVEEEEATSSYQEILELCQNLGFIIERYSEYEGAYELFNGEMRIYLEDGTICAEDI